MTHPASAGLRELADKLDALAAAGCVLDQPTIWIEPKKNQFHAAMQHFGIVPAIRKSGSVMDRWARAGGMVTLSDQVVRVESYVSEVCDEVEATVTSKTWVLPEVIA